MLYLNIYKLHIKRIKINNCHSIYKTFCDFLVSVVCPPRTGEYKQPKGRTKDLRFIFTVRLIIIVRSRVAAFELRDGHSEKAVKVKNTVTKSYLAKI